MIIGNRGPNTETERGKKDSNCDLRAMPSSLGVTYKEFELHSKIGLKDLFIRYAEKGIFSASRPPP